MRSKLFFFFFDDCKKKKKRIKQELKTRTTVLRLTAGAIQGGPALRTDPLTSSPDQESVLLLLPSVVCALADLKIILSGNGPFEDEVQFTRFLSYWGGGRSTRCCTVETTAQ